LATSSWEQELYCLGVPPTVRAIFASVDEARRDLVHWKEEQRRLVILVRDLATLARIAKDGVLDGLEVNLGGIHFAPGRERVLPYLYLSTEDEEQLRVIAESGVVFTAQDLPGSRPVPLDELLQKT